MVLREEIQDLKADIKEATVAMEKVARNVKKQIKIHKSWEEALMRVEKIITRSSKWVNQDLEELKRIKEKLLEIIKEEDFDTTRRLVAPMNLRVWRQQQEQHLLLSWEYFSYLTNLDTFYNLNQLRHI